MLKLKSADEKAALTEGVEVRLEPGVQPIVAEFTRTAEDRGRLELLWETQHFRAEPLPQDSSRPHRAAQETNAFKATVRSEEGRFLAEEMSCLKRWSGSTTTRWSRR